MKRTVALALLVFAGACSSPPTQTAEGPAATSAPTTTAVESSAATPGPEAVVEQTPLAGEPRTRVDQTAATPATRPAATTSSTRATPPTPSMPAAVPSPATAPTSSTTVTTWPAPPAPTTTTTTVPPTTATTSAPQASTTTSTTSTTSTTTTTARPAFTCQARYYNAGGNYPHRFHLSSNWPDIRVWVRFDYPDGWSPHETGAPAGYEMGTGPDGSSEQVIPAGWEKRQPVLRFKPRPWTHGQPDTGWACEMKLPPL